MRSKLPSLGVLLVIVACGQPSGGDGADETGSTSNAGTATDAEAGDGDAGDGDGAPGDGDGEPGDGDGDGEPGTGGEVPPYCHVPCSDTNPCLPAQICEAGQCVVGCTNNLDCLTGDVCVDYGSGLHCANGCGSPADCVLAGGAWDEDNWSCEQGGCNYLGCHNDDECGPARVCRPYSGVLEVLLGYDAPVCVTACASAADCDLGTEPTTFDNFECVDGGCKWIGCLGDDECPGTQSCG